MNWLKQLFRTPSRDELVIAAYRHALSSISLSEHRFTWDEQFRIINLLKLTLKKALENTENDKVQELKEITKVLYKIEHEL